MRRERAEPQCRWRLSPRFDLVTWCARLLYLLFALLRTCRLAPWAAMTTKEVRANAHGLSYAALATLWQKRHRLTDWDSIYQKWEASVPESGAIDGALYDVFDPLDEFEVMSDNIQAFRRRGELFSAATRSIDIATYYIQADETGWATARMLAACLERGVRVRLIADFGVTSRKIFENDEVAEVICFLGKAGADYRLYFNPQRPYDATHRKAVIVDGETLITGGRNYANHYSGTEWRDLDLLLRGPSAAKLLPLFEAAFTSSPPGAPGRYEGSIFQTTDPSDLENNRAFRYLLQCIAASSNSLDIENAYYINHSVLLKALVKACQRGVRVRIFTNSIESNDLNFTNYRIYSGFADLIAAGVEVYLRRGKGRTLHCKYFVADMQWVGFGSSNLDFYSPRYCRELGLHVRSEALAQQLTSWFDEGVADAERVNDVSDVERIVKTQTIGRLFDSLFPDIQ